MSPLRGTLQNNFINTKHTFKNESIVSYGIDITSIYKPNVYVGLRSFSIGLDNQSDRLLTLIILV